MSSLETFPVPYVRSQTVDSQASDGDLFLRFPRGLCSVMHARTGEHERAFYARYLNDIQFLIDHDRGLWFDRRLCWASEDHPVIEFDPEWLTFIFPPKEHTQLGLFAWYWLWVEADRRLSVSRFAFEELEAAYSAATGPHTDSFAELYPFVDGINRALDGKGGSDPSLDGYLLDASDARDFRSRLQGERLWFMNLLIDYEPLVFDPAQAPDEVPAFSVRLYRVAGEESLGNVSGQLRAVFRDGSWKIDFARAANPRASVDRPHPEPMPIRAEWS